jgi:hypothetical protein
MSVSKTADMRWQGDDLYCGRRKLVRIVRDAKHPQMWRVEHPSGGLTDVVNRTRAKEAAMLIGRRMLDERQAA